MGYSTDERGRLCCDQCGNGGGVRKRKCPHMVLGDSRRGPRYAMHYCYPPALCAGCYSKLGGLRGVHTDERCGAGARASQAQADAIEKALDAGAVFVVSAWGDWQAGVPKGMVGVAASGRAGQSWHLVPAQAYTRRSQDNALSEFAGVLPWDEHPGRPTKQAGTLAELVPA